MLNFKKLLYFIRFQPKKINRSFLACGYSRKFLTGFTLIETIVAIFIFTLIIGAVSASIIMVYRVHGYAWQQSVATEEARRGIETMVKEIRAVRSGEDGSYPIEKAEDKEFIFYSDIDKDGLIERVRYFLGTVNYGSQVKECETFIKGGSCGVAFSDFLKGTLVSAQVKVFVDGDFGWNNKEYADIFTDEEYKLGAVCKIGCSDCLGSWQGTQTFNVTDFASDNNISFLAEATSDVDSNECAPHAMKARFEFSWVEDLGELAHEFKKGVIKPVREPSGKISYPLEQEEVKILTSYIRNSPPIFKYFNQEGQELIEIPARLKDTKVMEIYLIINVDPDRPPQNFELKSGVQLRNLKEE